MDEKRGVALSSEACADVDECSGLEWLLTDGHRGYALGSVSGRATRRYHGLLVAALPPEGKRHVLLGHLEELAQVGDQVVLLGTLEAAEGLADLPQAELLSFSTRPWPAWRFRIGPACVRREVQLERGGGLLVRWSLETGSPAVQLTVAPFLPFREADALTFANNVLAPETRALSPDGWDVRRGARPYASLPELELAFRAGGSTRWFEEARWLRGISLAVDLARGYDGHEDRFSPGRAQIRLVPGSSAHFAADLAANPARGQVRSASQRWQSAADAAASRWAQATKGRSVASALHWIAADDFLFRSPLFSAAGGPPHDANSEPRSEPRAVDRAGILAGFPWFGEWGRDVFLSLPGLTLARGDHGACAEVLRGALPFLRDGLLPNIYEETPEKSHYGSVDASLWFARAARLLRQSGRQDAALRAPLRDALREIHTSYENGTALGIRGDDEGLVHAGGPDLNPTWMDAQTSRGPVTPRAGCPVEIAALWILLLSERRELEENKAEQRELDAALERARATFRARFWLEDAGTLADLWTPGGVDRAVRPNMVLAAAMDTTPLTRDECQRLLEVVDEELVAEVGLRTLSPRHPSYEPRYEGGPDERDSAYHQGTVWPWLIGAYVELCLRTRGGEAGEPERLGALLDGLDRQLTCAGLGHVSEVFDGDAPRRPGGSMAQAWNTAELLRARALLSSPRNQSR